MKSKHIFIEQFAQPCITRHRGKEALSKLQKHLMAGPVEIDFSNCEIVSLSFLDELVAQIDRSFDLSKIVFRVPNELIEDKLARVSGIHNVTIYCRSGNQTIRKVTPQLPTLERATFVSSKVLLW